MRVVGIDPGMSGGVALLTSTGQAMVDDLPFVGKRLDAGELLRMLKAWGPIDMVIVEDVSARPGNGSVSSFNFGCGFGAVCAVVSCAGIPLVLSRPAIWKRAMNLNQDKERSRQRAIQLFPTTSGLSRRKDEGRAEALLLAAHLLRTENVSTTSTLSA
jgi:crossover junction endodeoxyribonuclease RuvC